MNRPDLATVILRVTLGVIFLTHGIPKLLGPSETTEFLSGMGVPLADLATWVLIVLEIGGGLLLLAGVLVAPLAALLSLHMLLGIILVHAPIGWYVVGPGQEGAEFNVLLVAALVSVILLGPGRLSVAAWRARRIEA